MKTLILIVAAVALNAPASWAQETTSPPKNKMELRTTRKGAELMATQPARPKPAITPEKSPVQYGGFLVEVTRPKPAESLVTRREPVAENGDSPNVTRDPVTGRIRGFVLFAIRF